VGPEGKVGRGKKAGLMGRERKGTSNFCKQIAATAVNSSDNEINKAKIGVG